MIKILAGILGIFGLLNLNDPDWFVWTPLYLQPIFILVQYQNNPTLKPAKGTTVLICVFLMYLTFSGSLNENQEINKMAGMSESERELFGVALVLIWNILFLNFEKNKKTKA